MLRSEPMPHGMYRSIKRQTKGPTFMKTGSNKLSVHVNIQISDKALQAIVNNAKQIAEKDAKDANGVYRVDTADQVSAMITRFLDEKDFDGYVKNPENYTNLSG